MSALVSYATDGEVVIVTTPADARALAAAWAHWHGGQPGDATWFNDALNLSNSAMEADLQNGVTPPVSIVPMKEA